jgi:cell wall-active antibiotic response 4TMS protein YvqF
MSDYERNCDCSCARCSIGRLTGGAMMVTVGVLFLLAEFTRWGFHETWPLLLIVLGLLQVMRHNASLEGHIGAGVSAPPQNPDSSQVPHV